MRTRFVQVVLAVFVALTLWPLAANAQYGRYLRDPASSGKPNSSGIVQDYGNVGGNGKPIQFDKDVTCPLCGKDTKVGEIKFDYDTYTGTPAPSTYGGAALAGGFYQDPGVTLTAGHHLSWVQVVYASTAGTNDWGLDPKKAAVFPDAKPGNPAYPFTSTPVTPANPPGAPTLAFQDFPSRSFAGGAQSWLAELGLVCIADKPDVNGVTQVYVLNTFLWGFGVTVGPNGITSSLPFGWSPGTTPYLGALNDYYDGSPPAPADTTIKSAKFNFQNGCDDCFAKPVPEPQTYAMLLAGLALLGYAARQARRKAPITR